jgi:type IV secretion system protein VirB6
MNTLFATAYQMIALPLQAVSDAAATGLITYLRVPLLASITLWIGFQAAAVSQGAATLKSLWHGVIRAAVIMSLLQSFASYQQNISGLGQRLPVELANAVAGAGTEVTNGGAFDTLAQRSLKAGLITWEHVPAYSFKASVLAGISIPLYSIAVLCFIAAAFAVYLTSTVGLQLFLAVGPLAVACYIFPFSRRWTHTWIGVVASMILTQLFAVAVLGLMTGSAAITTTPILADAASADANFTNELLLLLGNGVLLFLIAMTIKQLPGWAATITGGVYQQVGNLTAMAFAPAGAVATAAGSAGRAATQGAAALGRHASNQVGAGAVNPKPVFRSTATGKSIS